MHHSHIIAIYGLSYRTKQ
ncbi:hypothetical protein [Candidatus Desulfofervidus auxilii]|nr:hypothetical protein [Candidatus Desulfofervidus auxilii]